MRLHFRFWKGKRSLNLEATKTSIEPQAQSPPKTPLKEFVVEQELETRRVTQDLFQAAHAQGSATESALEALKDSLNKDRDKIEQDISALSDDFHRTAEQKDAKLDQILERLEAINVFPSLEVEARMTNPDRGHPVIFVILGVFLVVAFTFLGLWFELHVQTNVIFFFLALVIGACLGYIVYLHTQMRELQDEFDTHVRNHR